MQKLVVALGTLAHLLPHPFGVSSVRALALYSGAFAPARGAWLVPLLPLVIAPIFGWIFYLAFSRIDTDRYRWRGWGAHTQTTHGTVGSLVAQPAAKHTPHIVL